MQLPQVRQAILYQGQVGVPGSDVPRGLRTSPAGIVLFVDANHPNATATADGTDPENPLRLNAPKRSNILIVWEH